MAACACKWFLMCYVVCLYEPLLSDYAGMSSCPYCALGSHGVGGAILRREPPSRRRSAVTWRPVLAGWQTHEAVSL